MFLINVMNHKKLYLRDDSGGGYDDHYDGDNGVDVGCGGGSDDDGEGDDGFDSGGDDAAS